jgi:hypothetical protein
MFQASYSGVVNDQTVTVLVGDPTETTLGAWMALADHIDEEYTQITGDDALVGSSRLDLMELNDQRWEAVHGTPWTTPGEVTEGDRTYKVESVEDDGAQRSVDAALDDVTAFA